MISRRFLACFPIVLGLLSGFAGAETARNSEHTHHPESPPAKVVHPVKHPPANHSSEKHVNKESQVAACHEVITARHEEALITNAKEVLACHARQNSTVAAKRQQLFSRLRILQRQLHLRRKARVVRGGRPIHNTAYLEQVKASHITSAALQPTPSHTPYPQALVQKNGIQDLSGTQTDLTSGTGSPPNPY